MGATFPISSVCVECVPQSHLLRHFVEGDNAARMQHVDVVRRKRHQDLDLILRPIVADLTQSGEEDAAL